jgi:O-Antigen ligase
MSGILLSLWFATLSADRLDLAAGQGWFTVPPYLLLTPLLLVTETMRVVGRGGEFRVPRNLASYTLVASAFLSVTLVSVFYAYDIAMSAKRYALLVFQVYSTVLVGVMLAQRGDARTVLVRGAYWGLALGTLFNLAQLASWFDRGPGELFLLGGTLNMTANPYGPWAPRLSAQAIDMNRGGIVTLVYVFIVLRMAAPSRWRTLAVTAGVLGMMATLSRSVILAVLGTGAASVLRRRRLSLSPRGAVGVAVATAILAGLLLATPRTAQVLEAVWEPLANRFSTSEGSASVHHELLVRGFEIVTESPKNALVGIGYGNAFAYLQDIFPGNKYGNFHSLYLTLLAECGGLGLLLGVVLIFYAAARGGVYQPLIVGLAFFNIFYQTGTETVFWLALVLAWTRLGEPEPSLSPPAQPDAPPGVRGAGRPGRAPALPAAHHT